MPGALDDVTVVDFSQLVQGPLATQFLGDMGADVIKIEAPGGEWMRQSWSMANAYEDGVNLTFLTANRNKRSVELNIKDDEQLEVLYDVIADADVFVENLRPGVVDRLGLGYDDLSEINPGIVYCSASGYGEEGPYTDRPGQDLIIQGVSGLATLNGRADDPPTPVGLPLNDFYSAAMLAFAAVSALYHREQTGNGQHIKTDLLSASVHLQSMEIDTYLNTGELPERSKTGISHPYYQAPFGVYETADGHMTLSLTTPSVVGDALGIDSLEGYDSWETAYEHRDEIKPLIEDVLREEPTDYWIDKLVEHDIWGGPVQTMEEVVDDPQVGVNDMIRTVEHEELGEIELTGVPFRMTKTPPDIHEAPPALGNATEEVLREYGYCEAFIEELQMRNQDR
ncbi:CaiB/BaiF CoA transferase family protein [Natrinema gelatinilyticum]|uniref:CaiB/BaiF CoA transferase family protein n=1 Tax=Natrinema gelatinilyticum TaxID=2961571 RepID=UPI0020C510BA|nr:CoA transferase [Natrinema gelatinilyticum]